MKGMVKNEKFNYNYFWGDWCFAATQSALNALTTFTGTTHINITAGGPEPDVMVEYVQDTKAVIADIMAQINEIRGGIV